MYIDVAWHFNSTDFLLFIQTVYVFISNNACQKKNYWLPAIMAFLKSG